MGRKKKITDKPPAFKPRRGASAEPFTGLKNKGDKARKAKRAGKASPVLDLCKRLARTFGGDVTAETVDSTLQQIKERGLDLDDVAAVLVTRIAIVEVAFRGGNLSTEKALSELGSCTRQMADLAEQFRQQGRALPAEVRFTFDITSGAIAAPGELPEDAPILKHDPQVGDLIEIN